MKQYEQSEIDQTRGYFERQEFPVEEVNVEGIVVPYFVIPQKHEIIEFMQIGIDQEGRCAQAEERVVAQVPVEHAAAYIEKRKVFFEKLCVFFRSELDAQTGNYTKEDLHEAEASLRFLKSL